MKWVKANWLIIVLSVVALAAAPTMFYFSRKMEKALKLKVDREVQADWKEVTSRSVTYSVPDVKRPDAKTFEKSMDVNEKVTRRVAEARDAIKRESGLIGTEAVKFNEGNRKPMVERLFPEPIAADRNRLMYSFTETFVNTWPKAILEEVNARPPVDSEQLGASIAEYKKSREERSAAMGAGAMSPEEVQKLNDELLSQRVDRYRQWASQTSFYADTEGAVFDVVPTSVPNPLPSMARLWDWQLKVWIYEDLFRAFAMANSNAASGGEASVLTGPVKRVMKITIDGMDYVDYPDDQAAQVAPDPGLAAAKDPVTPDISVSITGRYSGPTTGNMNYDLRNAKVELIVSPDKLPYLFDALVQTNYMTVLSCDLEKIEPEEHLKKGYYYGDDHVVKATLKIETIWLRAWTKKHMPRTVRVQIGVPDDKPAEGAPADANPPQ